MAKTDEGSALSIAFVTDVKNAMSRQKLTLTDLAKKLDVSVQAVSKQMSARHWKVETMVRYARAVGIKLEIGATEGETAPPPRRRPKTA